MVMWCKSKYFDSPSHKVAGTAGGILGAHFCSAKPDSGPLHSTTLHLDLTSLVLSRHELSHRLRRNQWLLICLLSRAVLHYAISMTDGGVSFFAVSCT